MSDTDSDVTIEPDPSDWDHSPNLFTPSPPQSVSKRQSSYHQLSDSDNEEPCSSVKQSFQHQTTEDLSNGRSSPKLLKRINKSSLSKSPSSSSQKNEKSIVFGKIDDQNNSAKDKKLDASKGVPQKKLHDSQVLKRKHSSGDSSKRVSETISSQALPPCKYGSKCYRKNPDHLKEFSHPCKYTDIIACLFWLMDIFNIVCNFLF